MNMKMCFVNTAMAATCIAAGGGMVPTEDPPRQPPVHSPSRQEGTIHAGPGEGAQEPAGRAAARPPFDTSENACGAPQEYPEAPNDVQRTADQWERWFQAHNIK